MADAAGTADTADTAGGLRGHLARHALVLRPVPPRRVREPVAALPAGSLIVTDGPRALSGVELPPGCLVVAPGPAPRDRGSSADPVVYLDDAADLARVVTDDGRQFGQVRVIVSGRRRTDIGCPAPRDVLDVNDLAFAAAQCCAGPLAAGCCYAVLLLDAIDGTFPLPYTGVFGGLVRSLAQELSGWLVLAVVTDAQDPGTGLAQLAGESAVQRFIPLAYHTVGRRMELLLEPVDAPPAGTGPRLPGEPVVVATGGARGLTAHLVEEMAAGCTPHSVWLLGTGPAPDLTRTAPPLLPRAEELRRLMARHPSENLAALNRRYDRAVRDAERAETLRKLEKLCGPGRVHYRQCDVLDEGAVQRVIGEVLAVDGRVDVLVHGAGLARSAVLARKKLTDFRTVRDVKVRGYAHLRAALADHQPRLWCSISSVSAFTGLRGEFDYGAGNEFLLLAAAHARGIGGRDEVALASGLWVESGMASADTPGGAFLARQAEIGQLTDEQGREFFRTELAGREATAWPPPGWATWTGPPSSARHPDFGPPAGSRRAAPRSGGTARCRVPPGGPS